MVFIQPGLWVVAVLPAADVVFLNKIKNQRNQIACLKSVFVSLIFQYPESIFWNILEVFSKWARLSFMLVLFTPEPWIKIYLANFQPHFLLFILETARRYLYIAERQKTNRGFCFKFAIAQHWWVLPKFIIFASCISPLLTFFWAVLKLLIFRIIFFSPITTILTELLFCSKLITSNVKNILNLMEWFKVDLPKMWKAQGVLSSRILKNELRFVLNLIIIEPKIKNFAFFLS